MMHWTLFYQLMWHFNATFDALWSCYYVMKQRHQKPFHKNTLKITSGNKKSQITENFKRVWHNNSVWFICVKCTIKILRYFQSSRCPILIYNSQQPTSINEIVFIWRDLIFTLIALISKILFTRVSISIYMLKLFYWAWKYTSAKFVWIILFSTAFIHASISVFVCFQ